MFPYQYWKDSTVIVKVMHGERLALASGMVLHKDGLIGTVDHILNDTNPEIELFNKEKYVAEIVLRQPDIDLAFLKIKPKEQLKVVIFEPDCYPQIHVGQKVFMIYHPTLGLSFTLSEGIVSGIKREINVGNLKIENTIQIETPGHGHSGSPIFNKYGEVIGMLCAIHNNIRGTLFGISSVEIQKALSVYGRLSTALATTETSESSSAV